MRRTLVAAVVGVAAGGTSAWWLTRPVVPTAVPVMHLEIGLPVDHRVRELAVSADGRLLAYTVALEGPPAIMLRRFDTDESRAIEGTAGAHQPFFSPDLQWLAFFADDELRKVAVSGGPVQTICAAPVDSAGGSWTVDGRIIFAPIDGRGLVSVSADGGTPEPLTMVDRAGGEVAHGWPHVLPDGAGIVFTVARATREPRIAVLPTGESTYRLLLPVNGPVRYVSSGHLLYEYLGRLQALPFDLATLDSQGVPTPIARGIAGSPRAFDTLGWAALATSGAAVIAYVPGPQADPPTHLVWVERDGRASAASETMAVHQTPRLSPDGRRVAIAVQDGLFSRQVWVEDLRERRRTRLTFQGGENLAPVWSPDGRELTFASNRLGPQNIFVRSIASADDHARRVLPGDGVHTPASWRGKTLAFSEATATGGDIWLFGERGGARLVAAMRANERAPALSPDSQWLAYTSDASGTDEVYVQPIAGGAAIQVSEAGGAEPVWSRDGSELFYRHGDAMVAMMAAPILKTGASGAHRRPFERRALFERGYERDPGGGLPSYDVAPDGRFLMLRRADPLAQMRVIFNWHP